VNIHTRDGRFVFGGEVRLSEPSLILALPTTGKSIFQETANEQAGGVLVLDTDTLLFDDTGQLLSQQPSDDEIEAMCVEWLAAGGIVVTNLWQIGLDYAKAYFVRESHDLIDKFYDRGGDDIEQKYPREVLTKWVDDSMRRARDNDIVAIELEPDDYLSKVIMMKALPPPDVSELSPDVMAWVSRTPRAYDDFAELTWAEANLAVSDSEGTPVVLSKSSGTTVDGLTGNEKVVVGIAPSSPTLVGMQATKDQNHYIAVSQSDEAGKVEVLLGEVWSGDRYSILHRIKLTKLIHLLDNATPEEIEAITSRLQGVVDYLDGAAQEEASKHLNPTQRQEDIDVRRNEEAEEA
jgi:hypothetical protein